MFPVKKNTLREAIRRRAAAVLEALGDRGISEADVHTEFASAYASRSDADAAWLRLKRLENPTAIELALYAKALQVNTTWLISGDPGFINTDLMAKTCLCWLLPPSQHFVHYGATEPGSTHEWNPDCLVHASELTEELLRNSVLANLGAVIQPAAAPPAVAEATA
ncbi:hypothetical protein [Arthrobacter koreensis]|uniref:hypothetical protein n=1 Tax=Arthrobacter koreensis TaxID=199136 RepID=UPI0037F3BDB7